MKIAAKDIEKFIVNIPKNIKAVLLYGPDVGLVKTRTELIIKSRSISDKFRYEQIKNNPSLFLDSLKSINLFGEDLYKEKIVVIECAGSSLTDPVLSVLKNSNYIGLLLFYAGELGPESTLRRTFETNPNLAAIACYVDDQASVSKILQQQFKQRKITCEFELIQLLTSYISVGDHALVLNEIEKIILFVGDKKHITMDDLKDFLEIQGEVSFDKLCYQISLKQINNIELLLDKLQNEGHNLVSIIRMLMRHFNRLFQVKLLLEQGNNEQTALDSLNPNVFFKHLNDFIRSFKLWSKEELIKFLEQLNDLELLAKQNPSLANLSLRKAFISLK